MVIFWFNRSSKSSLQRALTSFSVFKILFLSLDQRGFDPRWLGPYIALVALKKHLVSPMLARCWISWALFFVFEFPDSALNNGLGCGIGLPFDLTGDVFLPYAKSHPFIGNQVFNFLVIVIKPVLVPPGFYTQHFLAGIQSGGLQ